MDEFWCLIWNSVLDGIWTLFTDIVVKNVNYILYYLIRLVQNSKRK
jgi:hypothetical protein